METYVDTHTSGVQLKTSVGRNAISDNELEGNQKWYFKNKKEIKKKQNHQWDAEFFILLCSVEGNSCCVPKLGILTDAGHNSALSFLLYYKGHFTLGFGWHHKFGDL